jgi:hypothetical protein
VRHGVGSEGGTGAAAHEESQASTALERERALTSDVKTLEETVGYAEYVRWCGRTGVARPPPTRLGPLGVRVAGPESVA